jgi:glycosyltransferase involved in cell wall biosynthesis
MSLRLAVVISHPTQHHSPFFRKLAQVPGLTVKVFYGCPAGAEPSFDPGFGKTFAWDVPLLEGYEHEFLQQALPRRQSFWALDGKGLGERLEAFAPHAMWVHGYGHRLCWRAARWARRRCAVIFFGDSELVHRRPVAVRLAKDLIVRWFFRRCDAFITIGDNNEAYYIHYGVPRSKLVRGAYPVDIERFQLALTTPGRRSRAEVRGQYGIPTDVVVALFLAKMMPIKRPGDLLEALASLQGDDLRLHALFVGDGPLRPELEQRARVLGLEGRVHFAGFVNQRDIPLVLEAGDILAMTSEKDPHPLAVTEALIAGNAVIASDRVGCVGPTDTVRAGTNALVYPCGDLAALADNLRRLATDRSLRQRMGEASRAIAATQGLDVTVRAVLRAIGGLRAAFARPWADVPEEVFQQFQQFAEPATAPALEPI